MSVPDTEGPKAAPLPRPVDSSSPPEPGKQAPAGEVKISKPAAIEPLELPEPSLGIEPASVLPEQAIARLKAFDAPPEAPFAPAFLAALPPAPARVLGEIGLGGSEGGSRPAMPVMNVETTSCILNLHWRLNHAPSAPVDWAAERGTDVEPGHFAGEASLPASALAPDFPFYEQGREPEPEPASDLAPSMQIGQFAAAVPPAHSEPAAALFGPVGPPGRGDLSLPAGPQPVDPLPVAGFRVPYLIAPSFRERPSGDPGLDPEAGLAPRAQEQAISFGPAEAPADARASGGPPEFTLSAIASPAASDAKAAPMGGAMEFMAFAPPSLPESEAHEALPGWHAGNGTVVREIAAFECRPSPVRARGSLWAASDALIAPSGSTLSPATVSPARTLLRSLPKAGAIAPHPGIRLPARPTAKPEASRLKPVWVAAGSAPKPAVRKRISPMPVPLPSPQGHAPLLTDFPLRAIAGTCAPELSTWTGWEILSPAGWNGGTAPMPLPAKIARPAVLPEFPLQAVCRAPERCTGAPASLESRSMTRVPFGRSSWPPQDTLAPVKGPKPSAVAVTTRFAAAPRVGGRQSIGKGEIAAVERLRPFEPASVAVLAWPAVLSRLEAILPGTPATVAHAANIGLCPASLVWEVKQAFWPASAQLKLLPVRKGPVLPPAPVWSRLGVPPR